MAEYFWGSISIGGKVKKDLIQKLHNVLISEINEETSPEEIMNDLQACVDKPLPVEWSQSDACWGEFPDIQIFCKEHNIQYLVKSDSNMDCTNQMVSYDGNREIQVLCNQDYDPVISKPQFSMYLAAAKKFAEDLTLVPLHLDSECIHDRLVALVIAKYNITDPLTILETIINERFPDIDNIPNLKFID